MKKLLGILVIGLLFCSIGYAKTKITEVKRSVKEDGDGINTGKLVIKKTQSLTEKGIAKFK